MSIGNTKFYPSTIEDRIYDIMNDSQYIEENGYIYKMELITAIVNLFTDEFVSVEYDMYSARTLQPDVFICNLHWVEEGHLHAINWMYKERVE